MRKGTEHTKSWIGRKITGDNLITTDNVCPRDDQPKSPTSNSLDPNLKTNVPRNKRGDHYEWIPKDQPPANEIHGEVGDPRNIIKSR
ncbi:hypothetical protein O181_036789 [Austropuccinia psidii MF-1]|uniref:Uncharacterized protein n=1 Tax=Austropuccinia psidii MF-1 TaxID=1389203 RepID=A0A9Q3D576_9BASI|nr:hypothetical protein [Austropuccinia psidii MF-1]